MFSPEQTAIGVLFTLYHGMGAGIIAYLVGENRKLREKVESDNETNRDIIRVQLALLSGEPGSQLSPSSDPSATSPPVAPATS